MRLHGSDTSAGAGDSGGVATKDALDFKIRGLQRTPDRAKTRFALRSGALLSCSPVSRVHRSAWPCARNHSTIASDGCSTSITFSHRIASPKDVTESVIVVSS